MKSLERGGTTTIKTYDGDDVITWSAGRDTIDGGPGELDIVSYEGMQEPIKVSLNGAELSHVMVEDVAATTAFYQEQNAKAEEERQLIKAYLWSGV